MIPIMANEYYRGGDYTKLIGDSGRCWGAVYSLNHYDKNFLISVK